MNLLVFGTGMIVNDFLNGVDEMPFNNIYLCGRNKEKVDGLIDKFKLAGGYYKVEEALSSETEVAYVGLPNNLHFEYAKMSLEAGKHVIVEKPFMSNLKEAKAIWEIAKTYNKMIFEASLAFYFPAYKSLEKDLNILGDIHVVECNFSQYSSRYDRFLNGDIAPVFNIENCGGALMDLNVYNLNLMVGLFEMPRSIKYDATIINSIDVAGIASLDYGDLKASCIASKSTHAPRHICIQGEKASVYLPSSMSRAYNYEIKYNDGRLEEKNFEDEHHRMYHEFDEFLRCISEEDFDNCERYINRCFACLELLDACRKDAGIVFNSDL